MVKRASCVRCGYRAILNVDRDRWEHDLDPSDPERCMALDADHDAVPADPVPEPPVSILSLLEQPGLAPGAQAALSTLAKSVKAQADAAWGASSQAARDGDSRTEDIEQAKAKALCVVLGDQVELSRLGALG